MDQNRDYSYGHEFTINSNGIYYPSTMPLIELQKFASNFTHQIISEVFYAEVKIVQIMDGKGLEWEISEFTEDSGNKKIVSLSRKYTFIIDPFWKVSLSYDHWYSGGVKERCQPNEYLDNILQEVVIKLQSEIKTAHWSPSYSPRIDKYLKNRNWTNILSLSKRSFREQTVKKNNLTEGALKFAKRIRKIKNEQKDL
ncbi:hypothetical protein FBD94_14800 [Pedobacter hiemivivus]|uniref:Uncharacterized protein n=1 Tax=Pedobacter hiemivivus TaxID=2530454 RepID=A0A4U1GB96_9SPHI|nr:hypothetical protein [Pedobacter hiemivivus]TKC60179.1 hypothetical protein FBD94_14800 [Pedobacter hiemivivus]